MNIGTLYIVSTPIGNLAESSLAEIMARTLARPPSPRRPLDVGGAEAPARGLAGAPPLRPDA